MSLSDLQSLINSGSKLTPMMEQYYQIKKNHPDILLLFRMGDFYEVFFEDAKTTSRLLNITLTHRGKISDTPIPMAGIPHHAASTYIDRLTQMGLKVAICEQVQNPKDAVGIVKRAVTQIVSPGMPFDLDKTQGNANRFMAAGLKSTQGQYYLVALDFTTGDFRGYHVPSFSAFIENLRLISPKEFITFMGQWENESQEKSLTEMIGHLDILKTHLSEEYFQPKFTEIYIEKLIPGYKRDQIIKMDEEILSAIGALSYYISSTQKLESFVHLRPFKMVSNFKKMKISMPTLEGLEILPKTKGQYKDSLLGFFDKTETAMGSRYIRQLFISPLVETDEINKRQNIIQFFLENDSVVSAVKSELSQIRDLERIMAKISMEKGQASDLINLARAINAYEAIVKSLTEDSPLGVVLAKTELQEIVSLAFEITQTINDEIGASLEKGNLIKEGVNKGRDRLAKLHLNITDELLKMENELKEKTGILKLKIKSNNVSGFFIEVSKGNTNKVPNYFDRRQTLVNAERYTTPELTRLENETLSAQVKLEKLEREIFKGLILKVSQNVSLIQKMSEHIGFIDSFLGLALVAEREQLSRPKIQKDEKIFQIKGGFHPLIKSIIRDQFVGHDLNLNEATYFGLITGPNMAGKTTVMREVAIIQLLAQIGSYVPAESANLGICDYLFSRLGASDDILRGQSTFMVEMSETAEILRHATDRSLIILDEVGRGTSTYDGLSIAWGLVEYFIKKVKALTLFATHYHELIDVVSHFKEAKNLTVQTYNHKGNVQFLYKLIEEPASQSFGLYVAKMAGLPPAILKRSEEILNALEEGHSSSTTRANAHSHTKKDHKKNVSFPGNQSSDNQLCFFDSLESEGYVQEAQRNQMKIPTYLSEIENQLEKMDIMRMTPIDALLKLHELKKSITFH